MKARVYELARQLGLSSKELIKRLKALDIKVKSHASTLDEETVELVKDEIADALRIAEEKKKEKMPVLKVDFPVSVKGLSIKLNTKPAEIIKLLMKHNLFATINQNVDDDMAREVAEKLGYRLESALTQEEELLAEHKREDKPEELSMRAPIVTLMGHVDHGKTLLLDTIRKTRLVEKEEGGITQHIGAYEVETSRGRITFLDTPGHEAFSAMRARGANVTDIVVLVVAADDGVMPQTKEAIDHARAAGVPIVVAINKCDLERANPEKVKQQLGEFDLTPEERGGKTITVDVSAKTGEGVDNLLELLLLEAEMLELKANPSRPAKGIVIEGRLSKGSGPVAAVLVQSGILKLQDVVTIGAHYGKIKTMKDDRGRNVREALPSKPVEVSGLSAVPSAGDRFYVVRNEKEIREISNEKIKNMRLKGLVTPTRVSLEDLYREIQEEKVHELRVVVKADAQGSMEAFLDSIKNLQTDEVSLRVIHAGIGNINSSDIMLAAASNAVVIGFHVIQEPKAMAVSRRESVEVKSYGIIYEAVSEIKAAMEGLLGPEIKEIALGKALVKEVFQVSKVGTVAGCVISEGKLSGQASVRLLREGGVVFSGRISSLRRFKDDVKEVSEGSECGIGLEGCKDIHKGDVIEAYYTEEVKRKL